MFLKPQSSKYSLYANIFFTKYQLPQHLRYVIGPTLFGRLETAHSVSRISTAQIQRFHFSHSLLSNSLVLLNHIKFFKKKNISKGK